MYFQKLIQVVLISCLLSFIHCVMFKKSMIEEKKMLNCSVVDGLYQKLDAIAETLNEKSTKIGICTKKVSNLTYPKSCADLRLAGATCDGTYVIYPSGLGPVTVRCDMTTLGGGWTILLRRGNYGEKKTSFLRNWEEYKNGFGDTEGELWLGNEVVHRMTAQANKMELQIRLDTSLSDTGLRYVYLAFSSFTVGNESSEYILNYTTDNNFRNLLPNSQRFRTYDRELRDEISLREFPPLKSLTVGWWSNCRKCLTAEDYIIVYYPDPSYSFRRNGEESERPISVNNAVMMMRPENFMQ